jgi:hypothetical protein
VDDKWFSSKPIYWQFRCVFTKLNRSPVFMFVWLSDPDNLQVDELYEIWLAFAEIVFFIVCKVCIARVSSYLGNIIVSVRLGWRKDVAACFNEDKHHEVSVLGWNVSTRVAGLMKISYWFNKVWWQMVSMWSKGEKRKHTVIGEMRKLLDVLWNDKRIN